LYNREGKDGQELWKKGEGKTPNPDRRGNSVHDLERKKKRPPAWALSSAAAREGKESIKKKKREKSSGGVGGYLLGTEKRGGKACLDGGVEGWEKMSP